ncbi:MAG: DUF3574 domain-containing protein [Pyrinomonadaceae bacterium]
MKNSLRLFLLLAAICVWCDLAFAQAPSPARATTAAKAEKFLRTELYFGRSKPDGSIVSDEDWSRFLAEIVTPRFPNGFTVLQANGQYRDKSGKIITEPSEVLIFLYDRNSRISSRRKIEEIRSAYMKQFSQESVLRMDMPKSVSVFF